MSKCGHPDSEFRWYGKPGKRYRNCLACQRLRARSSYDLKRNPEVKQAADAAEREAQQALIELREWMQSDEARRLVA